MRTGVLIAIWGRWLAKLLWHMPTAKMSVTFDTTTKLLDNKKLHPFPCALTSKCEMFSVIFRNQSNIIAARTNLDNSWLVSEKTMGQSM